MSEPRGEYWTVIHLKDKNNTFIVIDKIDVIRARVRFVRFVGIDDNMWQTLRKNYTITKFIQDGLDDPTKIEYVPIPDDFIIYNDCNIGSKDTITPTEFIAQQTYQIIQPIDTLQYMLQWKQHPMSKDDSGKRIRPTDNFCCMYRRKVIHTLCNVITDQWTCNRHPDHWSTSF
jgi:hypothetical protein